MKKSDYHFGYESNGRLCGSGCHHGIGDISPEERAARAARMRDTMPTLMPEDMKAFLTSWEKHHGKVNYRMDIVGCYSGSLEGSKHMKGQPLKGAVFVQSFIPQPNPYQAYKD